jgi:hypothetical protein
MIAFDLILDRELPPAALVAFAAGVFGIPPREVYVGPDGTDPGGPPPRVWCWYTAVNGEFHWSISVSAGDDVAGPDEPEFARQLSRHFGIRVLVSTESPSYEEWRLISIDEDRIVHLDMAEFDNDKYVLATKH